MMASTKMNMSTPKMRAIIFSNSGADWLWPMMYMQRGPLYAGVQLQTRQGNMWVHSKGEPEPTCARTNEATFLQIIDIIKIQRGCTGEAWICMCVTLLTCRKVRHCPGGTCTLHRYDSSLHVHLNRICVSAGPEVPPYCLQEDTERESSVNYHI